MRAISARRDAKRRRRLVTKKKRALYKAWLRAELSQHAPMVLQSTLNREYPTIVPPSHLDLEANYTATIDLIRSIRHAAETLNGQFLVDFKNIETMSPAATLLLVAECDRWRQRTPKRRLSIIDAEHWDPGVKRRLAEMGFFEVLECSPLPPRDAPTSTDDRFIKFLTGSRNAGKSASDLREKIDALGLRIADRHLLYDGLVEAMTNTHQHAYRQKNKRRQKKHSGVQRWWISASVNTAANQMTVMALDHGHGIARTLPRNQNWWHYQTLLGRFINDDARRLEVAFDESSQPASSTGLAHRGKGLRENVKGYVSSHDSAGKLTVISNRGLYKYSQDGGSAPVTTAQTLDRELPGTFIQWVIKDYSDERIRVS